MYSQASVAVLQLKCATLAPPTQRYTFCSVPHCSVSFFTWHTFFIRWQIQYFLIFLPLHTLLGTGSEHLKNLLASVIHRWLPILLTFRHEVIICHLEGLLYQTVPLYRVFQPHSSMHVPITASPPLVCVLTLDPMEMYRQSLHPIHHAHTKG